MRDCHGNLKNTAGILTPPPTDTHTTRSIMYITWNKENLRIWYTLKDIRTVL